MLNRELKSDLLKCGKDFMRSTKSILVKKSISFIIVYSIAFRKAIVYNASNGGNTNRLLRHICLRADSNGSDASSSSNSLRRNKKIIIKREAKKQLTTASVQYVATDLHSYNSVEGEGFFQLCKACMQFGQSHRTATTEDLKQALPSRNTVKAEITDMAMDYKKRVSEFIEKAIESGGIAATTDTWTDDYRHTTYISIGRKSCQIYM